MRRVTVEDLRKWKRKNDERKARGEVLIEVQGETFWLTPEEQEDLKEQLNAKGT